MIWLREDNGNYVIDTWVLPKDAPESPQQDWTDWQILACSIALLLSYATRVIESFRFGLSLSSAIVHPLGIICFLCIQWFGFIHRLFGLKTFWKGRPLSPQ